MLQEQLTIPNLLPCHLQADLMLRKKDKFPSLKHASKILTQTSSFLPLNEPVHLAALTEGHSSHVFGKSSS